MKRMNLMALGAIVIIGVAVAAAPAASAAPSVSGGSTSCSHLSGAQVQINSTAWGRVNHKEGVTVLDSWNNGGSYQNRFSLTAKTSVPSWSAYITGSAGGDVSYANAVCRTG